MESLHQFNRFTTDLPDTGHTLPALFIDHGSPMNGIEDNDFTQSWKAIAASINKPAAVLLVSAHWLTEDTLIYMPGLQEKMNR